jgi:hyperosmotically inducible protein
MRLSRFTAAALVTVAFAAACGRAPVGDAMSSRADDGARTTTTPRATADSPATTAPTRLLPPAEVLDDGIITARIRAALLIDPAMGGSDVSVNTDRGVVSLTGVVASREQAAIASGHAQAQDGVMRVDDHLAVELH